MSSVNPSDGTRAEMDTLWVELQVDGCERKAGIADERPAGECLYETGAAEGRTVTSWGGGR